MIHRSVSGCQKDITAVAYFFPKRYISAVYTTRKKIEITSTSVHRREKPHLHDTEQLLLNLIDSDTPSAVARWRVLYTWVF
jgi:hypothetical protein